MRRKLLFENYIVLTPKIMFDPPLSQSFISVNWIFEIGLMTFVFLKVRMSLYMNES